MDAISSLFGADVKPEHLTILQVAMRALLIFFSTLAMLRIADKRFMAKRSAFDVILGFMLASMLSRVINGAHPIIPSIVGGLLLVAMHRLLATAASRSHWLSELIKGSSQMIIENGAVQEATLRRHHMGKDDLDEELRLEGIESARQIKAARLERNGEISLIKKTEK